MIDQFFEAVWGREPLGRFGEIRTIQGGRVEQQFVSLDSDWPKRASDVARRANERGADTYYGVLPRLRASGTNEDVADLVPLMWADVDAKKVSDVLATGKFGALAAINAFPVPPQILVDSGGGWHAYWLLDRPSPYALARPIMQWIARALNGDFVQDKARVLRVPGTLNYKRDEPSAARLVRLDLTRKYRLADFEGLMPIERERKPFDASKRIRIDNLPDWLTELIAQGAPKGTRSETCFRVIVWLLRYGRTADEIRDIFRANPDGIGEKYAEKSMWDGDRWLDYTIRAAEAVA